jgi:hypothetical protein
MMPEWWGKFVRVDELVECYDIKKSTEQELLRVADENMPGGAYGGELPGEDDWPEPDAKRDEPYKLVKIWDKLSDEAKADITKVYEGLRPTALVQRDGCPDEIGECYPEKEIE